MSDLSVLSVLMTMTSMTTMIIITMTSMTTMIIITMTTSWALAFAKSTALKAMWGPTLTRLSPSSPQQLNYGYQNWESGDIIILNQSSGHARTLGYQGGDFCQPKLWRHRFTLDTRGSRSPFPLTSEDEDKPKFTTKKQDSERGFSQQKAPSILVPPLLPFWTIFQA